jgi:hypothetical protein
MEATIMLLAYHVQALVKSSVVSSAITEKAGHDLVTLLTKNILAIVDLQISYKNLLQRTKRSNLRAGQHP